MPLDTDGQTWLKRPDYVDGWRRGLGVVKVAPTGMISVGAQGSTDVANWAPSTLVAIRSWNRSYSMLKLALDGASSSVVTTPDSVPPRLLDLRAISTWYPNVIIAHVRTKGGTSSDSPLPRALRVENVVESWRKPWGAQKAPPSASWNFPPEAHNPPPPLQTYEKVRIALMWGRYWKAQKASPVAGILPQAVVVAPTTTPTPGTTTWTTVTPTDQTWTEVTGPSTTWTTQ